MKKLMMMIGLGTAMTACAPKDQSKEVQYDPMNDPTCLYTAQDEVTDHAIIKRQYNLCLEMLHKTYVPTDSAMYAVFNTAEVTESFEVMSKTDHQKLDSLLDAELNRSRGLEWIP